MIPIYEAIFEQEPDIGFSVVFPDIPGCVTQGSDIQEAAEMAYDVLGLMVDEYTSRGAGLPAPTYGHKAPKDGLVVAFAVNPNDTFTAEYVSVNDAANMLSVAPQRIQALIKSGDIKSDKVGTARTIDVQSVVDYRARRQSAGRPKKALAA